MRRENTKTWLHKNAANFRSLLPSGATKADFLQTSLSADMRETTAVKWQKNPGFLFLFLAGRSYTNRKYRKCRKSVCLLRKAAISACYNYAVT